MADPVRPVAVLAMTGHLPRRLFPPPLTDRLHAVVDVDFDHVRTDFATVDSVLADADVLITGWGCPMIDESVLAAAPRLRAVVHAAGTVKGHVGAAVFDRNIVVSSAASANALPVAEYTIAMILLANKDVLAMARRYRAERRQLDLVVDYPETGNCRRGDGPTIIRLWDI